jgi:hypothetical protein
LSRVFLFAALACSLAVAPSLAPARELLNNRNFKRHQI